MTYDPMRDISSSILAAKQTGLVLRQGRVVTTFVDDSATYANLEMVGHKLVPRVLVAADVLLEPEDTAWVADMGMGRWIVIARVAAGRTPAPEPPPPPPPPPPADTTAPSIPTHLTAVGGNSVVTLDWTPSPEGDVKGYNMYRGAPSPFSKVNSILIVGAPHYVDAAVTNGVTYTYKVSAVDNSGNESAASTTATATPVAAPPPPPPPPDPVASRRLMFDLAIPTGGLIVGQTYPKRGQNALPVNQRLFTASVFAPYNQGQFKRMDLDLYVVVDSAGAPANTSGTITITLKNLTTAVDVASITVAAATAPNSKAHIRATQSMTGLTFLDGQEFCWFITAAPSPCKYAANVRVHYDLATV